MQLHKLKIIKLKKTIFKKILLILFIVLVAIQFIHPAKNQSIEMPATHIYNKYATSQDVQQILATACNDCHTNNTNYPWYASIQPVDWWLNDHIKDGKKHFNMSEFGAYSLRKQYHKLEEVVEQIKEKEMPLSSYSWIHGNAKLSAEQQNKIIGWATAIMDTMKATYPLDSLIRKKKPTNS